MNWQPIETAPLDGRKVLIAGGTYFDNGRQTWIPRPFHGPTIAFWDGVRFGVSTAWCLRWRWNAGWSGTDRGIYWHEPTHWMPLPSLPEVA